MRRSINFWQALQTHPPALIRLYARRVRGSKVEAVTAEEIAVSSGIPLARVIEISGCLDWSTTTITEAERFCAAAGFDPTSARDRNRERAYSRICQKNRPRFQWLKRHPRFESEFRPLIAALRNSPVASSLGCPAPASPTKN